MQETQKSESTTPDELPEIVQSQEVQRGDQERYLRLLADFDNYRRRVDRERSSAARAGKRAVILPLLDVLDDFDRALRHLKQESSSVSEGLEAILRKLAGVLDAEGVAQSLAWANRSILSHTKPSGPYRALNTNGVSLPRRLGAAIAGETSC